jgi:predicted RNase H-like HicB family nuclease
MQGYDITLSVMSYGVLFEPVTDKDFPAGYYYAHIPSLALTTHGLGIDGASEAARDLLQLWIAEKRAQGETVPEPTKFFFSTLDLVDNAV